MMIYIMSIMVVYCVTYHARCRNASTFLAGVSETGQSDVITEVYLRKVISLRK